MSSIYIISYLSLFELLRTPMLIKPSASEYNEQFENYGGGGVLRKSIPKDEDESTGKSNDLGILHTE